MFLEWIAEQCHIANITYGQAAGKVMDPRPFYERSPEFKAGCVAAVTDVIAHPAMTPEQSHMNWMKAKEAAGWRYGPNHDVENKLHPDMVPFDDLPEFERIKDSLFILNVLSMHRIYEQTVESIGNKPVYSE